MNQTSRIYVAGHRGLVGSAIVRQLHARGYGQVFGRTHGELDLCRADDVQQFFEAQKPEYVFLAAARVGGIYANSRFPVEFLLENLKIQNNIIEAAWRSGVKGLVFFGSSCIYPKHAIQPIREESLLTGPLEPTNEAYAVAKIAGIELCEAYNRQHGARFISVMPANLYGPNDHYDLEQAHVLPSLIRKFHLAKHAVNGDWDAIRTDEAVYGAIPVDFFDGLKAQPPFVRLWGSGTALRELLHVDDMADASVFIMERLEAVLSGIRESNDGRHLLNVGVGLDLNIRELAEMVANIVGFSGSVTWDRDKPDGTPRKLLDISRLSRLGWRSRIRLEDGIRLTYEEYKDKLR
jgi:GDP-L-fucose synthase